MELSMKSGIHFLLYLGYQRMDFQDGLHLACDSYAFHTHTQSFVAIGKSLMVPYTTTEVFFRPNIGSQ
jgi:hypothetical protein